MSETLVENLKAAIAESGVTRFVHGKRGLSLESASKLADVLNLELRPRRKVRKD
jgi:plasmid maintenance system antidote protein VapI